MPYLVDRRAARRTRALAVAGRPRALRRHHQVHPVRRLHQSCPSFWAQTRVRRPGGDRQRPPLHLRHPRPRRRRAAGDPERPGRRLALPDGLQLHRRLPARHQHHPGDPRGIGRAGSSPPDRAARARPDPHRRRLAHQSRAGRVGRRCSSTCHGLTRRPRLSARCRHRPRVWASRPTTTPSTWASSWPSRRRATLGAREVHLVLDSTAHRRAAHGPLEDQASVVPPLAARADELLRRFERWSIRHEAARNSNRQARRACAQRLDVRPRTDPGAGGRLRDLGRTGTIGSTAHLSGASCRANRRSWGQRAGDPLRWAGCLRVRRVRVLAAGAHLGAGRDRTDAHRFPQCAGRRSRRSGDRLHVVDAVRWRRTRQVRGSSRGLATCG